MEEVAQREASYSILRLESHNIDQFWVKFVDRVYTLVSGQYKTGKSYFYMKLK
jgi:hypothetical protein